MYEHCFSPRQPNPPALHQPNAPPQEWIQEKRDSRILVLPSLFRHHVWVLLSTSIQLLLLTSVLIPFFVMLSLLHTLFNTFIALSLFSYFFPSHAHISERHSLLFLLLHTRFVSSSGGHLGSCLQVLLSSLTLQRN